METQRGCCESDMRRNGTLCLESGGILEQKGCLGWLRLYIMLIVRLVVSEKEITQPTLYEDTFCLEQPAPPNRRDNVPSVRCQSCLEIQKQVVIVACIRKW